MTKTERIVVDGSPMDVLVALPEGRGPYPGILLSHYQHGLGPFTQHVAGRLCGEGFAVVAPDHYHHTPGEPDLAAAKAAMRDSRIVADMQAATDYLRALPPVSADSTAIMGHCMGGRHSLLGAATVGGFRCGIDCYGGGVMTARGEGPTVFERLSGIRCPFIGFFGAEDTNPSPADARKVETALRSFGVPCDFTIYDDAAHSFMDVHHERYAPAAAEDAWRRIFTFLRQHTEASAALA